MEQALRLVGIRNYSTTDMTSLLDLKKLQSRLSNRSGRALSGLLTDYAGTAISVGISFLVTPLLLTILSAPMYGFWITTAQIIFFLNLADGGASIYLINSIAKSKEEGKNEHLAQLISTTFWLYVFMGVLVCGIGLVLAPFIATWLKINAADSASATITFQIAVFNAVLSLIVIPTFYGVLQGYQKLALVNGIVYSVSILSSLLSLGLLSMKMGVTAMALGQLIATMVGASIASIYAKRVCPSLSFSPQHFRWSELRQILHFTGYFQMSKLAFLASTYSDTILIASYYGTAPVAAYSITQKLPSTASMFMNKVGGMIMPGLSELFAAHDVARLQVVVLRLTRLLVRFGLLSMFLVIALNKRFVYFWISPTVFGGIALTVLFAYSIFRNGLIRNLATLFFSSGQLKAWGWLSLLEAALKIPLTILLFPLVGLLAPVGASAIAELLTGFYTPVRIAQLIELPLVTLLSQGVMPPLLLSLPTIGGLFLLDYLLPLHLGWLGIICIGLCGILVNTLSFDRTRWSVLIKGLYDTVTNKRPKNRVI